MSGEMRCPATTRADVKFATEKIKTGVQCKFTKDHEGDHCGYNGPDMTETFWPNEPVPAAQPPQCYGA